MQETVGDYIVWDAFSSCFAQDMSLSPEDSYEYSKSDCGELQTVQSAEDMCKWWFRTYTRYLQKMMSKLVAELAKAESNNDSEKVSKLKFKIQHLQKPSISADGKFNVEY